MVTIQHMRPAALQQDWIPFLVGMMYCNKPSPGPSYQPRPVFMSSYSTLLNSYKICRQ